jgi:TetR/AcrR family transcriptional regulator, cholesterol catabolism regulator
MSGEPPPLRGVAGRPVTTLPGHWVHPGPAGLLGAGPVTASQRARRDRMLAAAVALAAHGGYDAVAMREVAERAGVALGTLYRYFPSKVHLLASVLGSLLAAARDELLERPPAGDDPASRVLSALDRLVDLLEGHRLVSEALIQAMSAADVTPSVDIESVYDVTIALIALAAFGPEHQVDEADKLTTGIVGKVFLSDLRHWLGGRVGVDDIRASLAETVAVVLAGQESLGRAEPRPRRPDT